MYWGEKRFNNLDFYLKKEFGEKVFKVSLDGGFTCPNRDGTLSTKGCIFCSESGSGEFVGNKKNTITEQIENQIEFLAKGKDKKYIAYFQNFTGTYGDMEYLNRIYEEALAHPNIVGIAIGTRADCLGEDVLNLLDKLNRKTFLWVEIGLQSSNNDTAKLINRGYETQIFSDKMEKLRELEINVVCHVILGLPNETEEEVLSTIKYLNNEKIWGAKLHLLYILKNTGIYEYYLEKPFLILEKSEYIKLVCKIISILDESILIHRLTGDPPWKDLIEPKWSTDKKGILNGINKYLKENDIYQGKNKEKNLWI